MALEEVIKQIDELQSEIDSHRVLDKNILKKIQYKFRLDWNYHSNAMEGNSLTQLETRSVMINNVTVDGKPLKDVIEIRGHDSVITDILKIGKGELRLSEKRILDIHKAIINEENVDLAKQVGKWKTIPNHIINYKNEKYDFTLPADVPEEIHQLLNWLNAEYDAIEAGKDYAIHPVILAFKFHLKYISIHPFYDGNGRTARIFTNLILIALGYPPVIIEVTKKNIYNQYLADIQCYEGKPNLLFEFMAKQLIHSQQLVLSAIAGNDIDEQDDLDKKLLLLEKELNALNTDNEVKEQFSADVFFKMYDEWISRLLSDAITIAQKFNKFFTGTDHHVYVRNSVAGIPFTNEEPIIITESLKKECEKFKDRISPSSELEFLSSYSTFIKGGLNTFNCRSRFSIKFESTKYIINIDKFFDSRVFHGEFFIEKLLHQALTDTEIKSLIKILGDSIYEQIEFNTKNNGIIK
jgi:Fic family protein